MKLRKPPDDARSAEQIRQHYEVEVELASVLRSAPKDQRLQLYARLYNELYLRVPAHPQLTRKASAGATREAVDQQMRFLRRFLRPDETYLEIGAGDCALAVEVARHVRKAYALDVSEEVVRSTQFPANGELLLSDGCSVPVSPGSVHVAYSNQLMEHLHPDDALEQLQNIHRALADGGSYICITPNRLNGPHDVSQYFDDEARGFHMKEYTTAELMRLFLSVGFRRVTPYLRVLGRFFAVPGWIPVLGEGFLGVLPARARYALATRVPFRWLLGIQLVGGR
jgi:SAM-dependent methyltransferase